MNITFALDDELIGAAKAVAARRGTSVSALVRAALEVQVALDGEVRAGGASGVIQVLIDYSLGRVPRAVAMSTLGTDDYGVLLQMLNAANLPHPIVPLEVRRKMAAQAESVLVVAEDGL